MQDRTTRFEWRRIGLVEKIESLLRLVDETGHETPTQNTRTLNKLARWKHDLNAILDSLHRISNELLPQLSDLLGPESVDNEVLQVAMFQSSTKNLFLEIEIHFGESLGGRLDRNALRTLGALGELAKVLALIGDAAISMAVLHRLWEVAAEEVGELTQRRARIVSNENMAALCDRWGLYERRIHFDPPVSERSEMEHVKGTLVEAIYGMVYLKGGLERITGLITHLIT